MTCRSAMPSMWTSARPAAVGALAVLAVFACMPAVAQAPAIQDVQMVLVDALELSQLHEYKGDGTVPSWPFGACNPDPAEGEPDHIFVGDGFFRFHESHMENACAEARFLIAVPAGADEVVVRFQADRNILPASQPPTQSPVNFEQMFRVYPDMIHVDAAETPEVQFEVFSPGTPTVRALQMFEEAVPLVPNATTLGLGWFFADRGATDYQQLFRPTYGHVVVAVTADIQLEFRGLDVVADEAPRSVGLVDGRRAFETAVAFDVPEPHVHGGHVELEIRDAEDVTWVRGPDGRDVAGVGLRRDGDLLRIVVPSESLAAHGAGTYRVAFLSTAPLTTHLEMSLLFGAALVLPLLAGVLAQRNVSRLSRVPSSALGWQRALQVTAVAFGVAWTVVVTATFALGNLPLLYSFPFDGVATAFYLLGLVVVLAFAAVAAIARRHEVSALAKNLTSRQDMERELRRSNAELEQFAYVASHDLKEPLRMVAGYTQLLERRYNDSLDGRGRTYIGYASEGAKRMQDMVDDLLTYSRVRAEDQDMQPIPLGDVVAFVQEQLAVAIDEASAVIEAADLPTVNGDRGRLVQLFQNLMQNSIKFRHADRPPRIVITAARHGERWRIRLVDNGIGMDPKDAERAFQIFQRLHPRDHFEGNGIGLAVVRKIVELHGGEIRLRAAKDKGATFTFDLEAA